MLLSFLAGIMPSLLLIKAVYCLGRGVMLGAVWEPPFSLQRSAFSARCWDPGALLSFPIIGIIHCLFFSPFNLALALLFVFWIHLLSGR